MSLSMPGQCWNIAFVESFPRIEQFSCFKYQPIWPGWLVFWISRKMGRSVHMQNGKVWIKVSLPDTDTYGTISTTCGRFLLMYGLGTLSVETLITSTNPTHAQIKWNSFSSSWLICIPSDLIIIQMAVPASE